MNIGVSKLIFHFYMRIASLISFRLLVILMFAIILLYLNKIRIERCNESLEITVMNSRQKFRHQPAGSVNMATKLIYKGKNAFFYNFKLNECIVKNCFITEDVDRVYQSDAVLINWFYQPRKIMRIIRRMRRNNQWWVFTTMEAPPHEILMVGYGKTWQHFKKLNGVFNWTMTYRQDSDIQRRYGRFIRRKNQIKLKAVGLHPKEKSVVWLVSNCRSSSKRASYVTELRKYIDVDIVGKCGNYTIQSCNRKSSTHDSCIGEVAKRYDFYLAFENSICRDYITEKAFGILNRDIVVVVMGGANYSKFMPPGSFVNVADFSSPKALAEYLILVRKNRKLYAEYFQWREKFVLQHAPGENELCELCRKLNDPTEPMKTYQNFHKWWLDDANCGTWNSLIKG